MRTRAARCRKNICLTLCWVLLLPFCTIAQGPSSPGTALLSSVYDTVITGIGYGTYNLNFPQWSPDSGTLIAIKVQALVTVQYGFTLKNVDLIPASYTVSVGREDFFSSPALATAYDNIMEQRIGSFPLDPGNYVTQSPFAFMNKYVNTDSITDNPTPFLGTGRVNFTYSPITYTDIHTNNNASYYYSAQVRDTTHFILTYLHTPTGTVLATDLTSFTVSGDDPSNIRLAWSVANEQPGRTYEVQTSRDGQQFTTAAGPIGSTQRGGTASYQYAYRLAANGGLSPGTGSSSGISFAPGVAGKWYFRIKITDPTGRITWSGIRQLTIGDGLAGDRMTLYPNPASDYVCLSFAPGTTGNWQIDILNAGGSLIQRNYSQQTGTIRVGFQHKLAAGTYFVRAMDRQTKKTFSSALFVTGQ